MIHQAKCMHITWSDYGDSQMTRSEKLCADEQEMLLGYCRKRFNDSPKRCRTCMPDAGSSDM